MTAAIMNVPASSRSTATALDDALRFVQMSGIFYCTSELTEPWGLALPPMENCLWFHVVTEGECDVEIDGTGDRHTLRAGDLIVIPHGNGHRACGTEPSVVASVFDLPHEYLSDRYAILRHGGGGARTSLVCGGVSLDHPAARHLVDALPAAITIDGSRSSRSEWMPTVLSLMADETRHMRAGSDAIVSRLCDVLVIQAIRHWIERDPAARTGWLGALRDSQIGAAIARIHAEPANDWTVASLAESVAMSRSAFAARFTQLVGQPAMRYVTRWRMLAALDLLQAGDVTVATAAARVGYESEAAFSRAFKREFGEWPGARSRRRGVTA